jgi:hypothetical protein
MTSPGDGWTAFVGDALAGLLVVLGILCTPFGLSRSGPVSKKLLVQTFLAGLALGAAALTKVAATAPIIAALISSLGADGYVINKEAERTNVLTQTSFYLPLWNPAALFGQIWTGLTSLLQATVGMGRLWFMGPLLIGWTVIMSVTLRRGVNVWILVLALGGASIIAAWLSSPNSFWVPRRASPGAIAILLAGGFWLAASYDDLLHRSKTAWRGLTAIVVGAASITATVWMVDRYEVNNRVHAEERKAIESATSFLRDLKAQDPEAKFCSSGWWTPRTLEYRLPGAHWFEDCHASADAILSGEMGPNIYLVRHGFLWNWENDEKIKRLTEFCDRNRVFHIHPYVVSRCVER